VRRSACLASPLLLALIAAPVAAQQPPAPPQAVELRYVGAAARIGIGYDSENLLRGDALWVFREDARSASIAELWASERSAGGVRFSHLWRPEGAAADDGVRKSFIAWDQNQWRDGKLTLGGGYEREKWFATAYASGALTGKRETATDAVTYRETVTGADNGRPYEQDLFTTTVTRRFERAYDYGIGARFGHFYDSALLRVEFGGDYEWGRASSSQGTLTLGVEKFFAGSPFSVAVVGEAYRKSGDYESRRDDQRVTAMLRYEFGGAAYRPAREYRRVEVAVPQPQAAAPVAVPTPPPAAPRIEKRLVMTTGSMASDAFFDLDSARLRDDARAALDAAATRLRTGAFEGNIRITGHTCNLGSAAHNLGLSQRRAQTVRSYLAAAGVPADRILTEGKGLAEPRYPNDATGRPKNRRVDIEFVTVEQREETVTLPPLPVSPAAAPAPAAPMLPQVEWRTEEIVTEPTWLRRALHSAPQHKQAVDVYTTQERTSTVTAGDKRYLNRGPSANADAYSVNADSGTTLFDVLANDTDPDGDALVIAAVRAPAHGTASISAGRIAYAPVAGYAGADSFSYTIADAKGATSTATVSVTVVQTNRPPVANGDFAVAGYNQPVTIDVLANDTDPDKDPLTVISFTQPANGKVTRGPGNTLVYLCNPNYVGFDAFSYTASDGRGGTASANVTVFADP
jgi:outer membrane protein OmpA-like peptidoglycan-associated protein